MPDLRSELEKVIHAWETPKEEPTITQPEPTMNQPTSPVTHTEAIFNYVKANAGHTSMEIQAALSHISGASLTSMLGDMARRHLLRKVGGIGPRQIGCQYEAIADKYMSPSQQLGIKKRKVKAKIKRVARRDVVVAAMQRELDLTPVAPLEPAPAPQVVRMSIRDIDVESLTVGEARALRDKLNALFGA